MPPSYLQRLRSEGLALALSGVVLAAVLVASTPQAHAGATRTALELTIVALLLLWLGPRRVHRAIAGAQRRFSMDLGSGRPRPLWQFPIIVVAVAFVFGKLMGWEVGLRAALACALVGLTQMLLLGRILTLNQGLSRRRYFRIEGSSILGGTRLGYIDD